jgi:putative ABC transport system ATP-binding protein
MIELAKITKIYHAGKPDEFTALKDVDLRIAPNSVTAFVGPSGSGKTTLLAVIGCMSRPTAGRMTVGGQETTSLPEKFLSRVRRSTFGFVFQDHNLIRGVSVLENTMLPAYPGGESYKELRERAMELLARLKIASKAQRRSEELSGGERQRAAIARALINEPAVVIADEPTAHLDTGLTMEFLEIAAGLAEQGKTLLIASHDPLVYENAVVGRVVQMRDGRILDGKRTEEREGRTEDK